MGQFPHPLSRDEKRKGGKVRQAKAAEQRRKAEEYVLAELAKKVKHVPRVYDDAMDAETPGSILTFKDGSTKETPPGPDHRVRIIAADRVLDRVLGKPTDRHELDVDAELTIVVRSAFEEDAGGVSGDRPALPG